MMRVLLLSSDFFFLFLFCFHFTTSTTVVLVDPRRKPYTSKRLLLAIPIAESDRVHLTHVSLLASPEGRLVEVRIIAASISRMSDSTRSCIGTGIGFIPFHSSTHHMNADSSKHRWQLVLAIRVTPTSVTTVYITLP
jgi:hypothetical protein